MSLQPVLFLCAGLGCSLLMIPFILRCDRCVQWFRRAADWHHADSTVPRAGGLVLVAALLVVEFLALTFEPARPGRTPEHLVLLAASLGMFALGFWDDVKPLTAHQKLLLQIFIATLVGLSGLGFDAIRTPFRDGTLQLGLWGPVLSILWLVSIPNLINLIDGIDGLAGGVCFMLLILLAVIGCQQGNFGLLACGLAGSLLGFLRYNLPPARVYLGDSGAYFLGFQIAGFSLVNSNRGAAFEVVMATLVALVFPLTDALFTTLRRGSRGLPLFRPDRKHLHHRLLDIPRSRLEVILWLYALNFVFFCVALRLFWSANQSLPWLLAGLGLLSMMGIACCAASAPVFAVHHKLRTCWRMRRQVQYALSLVRWLELEAQRRSALEEFWPNLVFTADKLGFASLSLTFQHQQRAWRKDGLLPGSTRQYALAASPPYTLELQAPACTLPNRLSHPHAHCDTSQKCPLTRRGCLAEPRTFETISDLFAESCHKAAARWKPCQSESGAPASPGSIDFLRGKSARSLLKATALFWLLLFPAETQSEPPVLATNPFEQTLRSVPLAELPAAASLFLKTTKPADRTPTAIAIVRWTARIAPAATVPTVAELARTDPASSAAIAEAVALELPGLAPEIVRASVLAAPRRVAQIVTCVGRKLPSDLRPVVLAAADAAPTSSRIILQAAGSVHPELSPFLENEIAKCGSADPSVSRCFDRAQRALYNSIRPIPPGSGQVRPTANIPTTSDPRPSKGGGHPPGGRNYAKP